MKKFFLLLIAVLILSCISFAEDRSTVLSPRVAGLGGAFIAISDDESALFYNPAGLSQVEKKKLVILNPTVRLGDGCKRMQDLVDETKNATSDDQRAAIMKKYIPLDVSAGVDDYPYYIISKFGFAYLVRGVARMEVLNPVTPRVEIRGYIDNTFVGSYSHKIKDKLALGVTLKPISRSKLRTKDVESTEDVNEANWWDANRDAIVLGAADMANASKLGDAIDPNYSASGFGMDIGAVYNLSEKSKIGLAIYDVGSTNLKWPDGKNTNITCTWGIGFAQKRNLPKALNSLGKSLKMENFTWAFDLQDLGKAGSIYTKMKIGFETNIWRKLNFRWGLNGGYPAISLGGRFGFLQIDYAYYSLERGEHAAQKEDKGEQFALTFRF